LSILDSITSDRVRILYEDFYLNITSLKSLRRIYIFVFSNEQELDGRYLSSLVLSPGQFIGINHLQNPLNCTSNQIPMNVVKQLDVQQITFAGQMSRLSAERILNDYWQNPVKQGLINAKIYLIESQEYLAYSMK
jgi:hypothetical protein